MSITSGFFDSQNHDRAYNATQFGSIFDGVITDGVYSTIGTQFQVKAAGGLVLNVGAGRAWFDHSWILNDTIYVITAPASHPLYSRIDAVVLDIDTSDDVRRNTIKYISGTAASTPVNPTLISETGHRQYPLAYILRSPNSSNIVQANITNMVGTSSCPFVAGVAGTVDIDELLAQWDDEFGTWFEGMKGQLSTDAAGHLQNEIDDLETQLQSQIENLESQVSSLAARGAMTLLWTNPNWKIDFSAQTVSLDLSGYTAIMVVFAYAKSQPNRRGTQTQLVDGATYTFEAPHTSAGNYWFRREVTASETGVKFGTGGYMEDGSFQGGNLYTMPLYIYGILAS